MKTITLSSTFNSQEGAFIQDLDNSGLAARNARNKYTKRAHWIETRKNGESRYCYSTYDESRGVWCNPKKGTYSLFIAMYANDDNTDFNIVGIGEYMDVDKMETLRGKYSFDTAQLEKIDLMIKLRKASTAAYAEYNKDAEKKFEETRKEASDFKTDHFYGEHQFNKCTTDLNLIKLFVSGYGIKKGCDSYKYWCSTRNYGE